MKSAKSYIAAALLLAGLIGLVGCIWIPGNYERANSPEPRPEKLIGVVGSDKPLWLGRASRQRVFDVLGKPTNESSDRRTAVYAYSINTGAIFFICGYALPTVSQRFLRVDFDEDGILQNYKVFKDEESALTTRP